MPSTCKPAGPEPAEADSAALNRGGGALTPVRQEIIGLCADTLQQLGLPRSVGQIYGAIYGSARPMAFADVVAALGISNGSVSQGLRFLRELGAIRPVEDPEGRREVFVAETELRKLLGGVLEHRFRAPLEASSERLKNMELRLVEADEPQREFLEQRIDSLRIWHRKALHALPLLQLFLGRKS